MITSPNGQQLSSVTLGSRVVVKGDLNSPVMTCVQPLLPQGSDTIIGWVCGWFNETFSPGPDGIFASSKHWNMIQLGVSSLEVAQEQIQ